MRLFCGRPKKQAGLSLVELMVALLISTILLLGVLELFGSSSQAERSANALARLQENGRLVMDLITREARRTGFQGCDIAPNTSVSRDFHEGGKIEHFPEESMQGSKEKEMTFRYFSISENSCNYHEGNYYYISFKNCKKDICVNSKDTGNKDQVLVDNASIEKISYMQPCLENNQKMCSYDLPKNKDGATSFAEVKKIQVQIKLCADEKSKSASAYCDEKSGTKIVRTFSSLIELRNRQ